MELCKDRLQVQTTASQRGSYISCSSQKCQDKPSTTRPGKSQPPESLHRRNRMSCGRTGRYTVVGDNHIPCLCLSAFPAYLTKRPEKKARENSLRVCFNWFCVIPALTGTRVASTLRFDILILCPYPVAGVSILVGNIKRLLDKGKENNPLAILDDSKEFILLLVFLGKMISRSITIIPYTPRECGVNGAN